MTNFDFKTKGMSKEEIADYLLGLGMVAQDMKCDLCPLNYENCSDEGDCKKDITSWLFRKIKTKKIQRIQTINRPEDYDSAFKDYMAFCDNQLKKGCASCKYNDKTSKFCVSTWLFEEIEIPTNE